MNTEQIEAIAIADAHANNAGLPTYSQLLAALKELYGDCVASTEADGYIELRWPTRKVANEVRRLLSTVL